MNDEPVDLSLLDPTRDPRFDQIVGRIGEEAAPLLAARRSQTDLIGEIGKWSRPVLAAAATVVLVLGGMTAISPRPKDVASLRDAELLGVPDRWSQWASSDRPPQPSSIVDFFVEQE